ncbi:MAG: transcriptional regulator, PadR-like family [Dehalococcoidia bacterium]|nr:transcriptional regulator, PadR-like family [Dehalococcoidia bacterium]
MYRKELLKGSTETLLLTVLAVEPMYGYQLVREMERRSGGYFRFKEGTLYPALHRLERDGLLDGRWEVALSGQRRRYYFVTAKGDGALKGLLEEWKSFSRAANLILQPGPS